MYFYAVLKKKKKHFIDSLNKTLCTIIKEKWGNMTCHGNHVRIILHIEYYNCFVK